MKNCRITFCRGAERRLDPFEFAWLLSKYDLEVMAKSDRIVRLFVQANDEDSILGFEREVEGQFGQLIFESIEVWTDDGYADIDEVF